MLTSTIKYNSMTSEEQTGSYNTEFLAALSAFGNRIMCRFSVNNELYQSDDIRFIKRYSVVSLLKSVMYAAEIRIDGIRDLKDKVITDLQFGVSEDGINYYLVSFGSFTITDSPSDLAGGFTTLTAYDGMLAAMKNYTPVTYSSGETNYTYFCKVASAINLSVGSSIPSTGLMAFTRIADAYTENNTYRDILDDYAEILGGCILVKNGALELVKPGNPVMTLDAGNLTNFAPKDPFPLIDNLIFTSEGSITYKKNEQETGTIIRIDDNRLINPVSVDTYMNTMWNAIRNWGAFIPVEADSHGYMLFEPCDVINFSVNGSTYRTIWMSNDITISQGIAETISSDEPADRADDYFNSDEEHNFAVMVNNKLSSMVRQYEDGVLVSRYGQNVGALVNADGSFDVVSVRWDSDNKPTVTAALASYGSDLMYMCDKNQTMYLLMEDLRGDSGVQLTEEKVGSQGEEKYLEVDYSVYSLTSVIRKDNSQNITSSCTFGDGPYITSNSIVVGKTYTIKYISKDATLKAYTFGDRTDGSKKGGQSISIGNMNTASGRHSFVHGRSSAVSGDFSTAFGDRHSVTKPYAFSAGSANRINHAGAIALGEVLQTGRDNQVVVGLQNEVDANKLFIVANIYNAFAVDTNGGIWSTHPQGQYTRLYASSDTSGDFAMWSLYNSANERVKRIFLRENNVYVDGVAQFHQSGERLTINSVSPYQAYLTNDSKYMRITIPAAKSLQFINSIEVFSMIGAIVGPNGLVDLPGGSDHASGHAIDWLSGDLTVTATKVDNHSIRVQLAATSAFYNAVNNRPYVYVPGGGGITFVFS